LKVWVQESNENAATILNFLLSSEEIPEMTRRWPAWSHRIAARIVRQLRGDTNEKASNEEENVPEKEEARENVEKEGEAKENVEARGTGAGAVAEVEEQKEQLQGEKEAPSAATVRSPKSNIKVPISGGMPSSQRAPAVLENAVTNV
jgi:hypothetical protein